MSVTAKFLVYNRSVARVQLYLLGAPRIELDGGPIEVDTRKAIALAAYLAVTAQPQTRDRLAATLWPEADEAKAHAALRRTLSVLNKALKGAGLGIEREIVTLAQSPEIWLDVNAFRAALAECARHGHSSNEACPHCRQPLTRAVELYRGDFLAGFNLRDSSEFDDWQFFQSETLRREFAGALERLIACHLQANEAEAAIPVARRWLALDPIHEPAHRQLMCLYAQTNQRAAALRQYQECVRILNEELGVKPLEETTILYEAIKENRFAIEGPTTQISKAQILPVSTVSNIPTGTPSRALTVLPLIGRTDERHALLSAYSAVGQAGQVVVLEGEAGIGKTRLAHAFLDEVRRQGGSVASVCCYEGELTLAYGAFVELLRSALRQPAWTAQLNTLEPHTLSEAARLIPELADRLARPDLPPASPLGSPGAQSRFFDGCLQVLSAASKGRPAVIFLDDVQWMDEASLDLLTYLVRRLPATRLCILLTWRSEQVDARHRLRQLLADALRAGTGRNLALGRLSESEVAELVERVSEGQTARLDQYGVHKLFDETEGLPLFVAEYLTALQYDSDWHLPMGVRGLLQSRLAAVSEAGRQLLGAAAVIGRSFDLDTLQAVSGRSLDETVTGLEALIGLGIVHEVGASDGSLRYDFGHDKLRALAYDETSLARRRLLHRRTAEALNARGRGGQLGPLASAIAQHYRLSGNNAQAAHYYKLAGDHARALYANADALGHYGSALALGYVDAVALHEAIGDLQTLGGDYSLALKSYESGAALGRAEALAGLEHKLGLVYERRGDAVLAEKHFEAALAVYGEQEAAARARVLADWSLSAHHSGQAEQAHRLAQEALALAEAGGEANALAQAHNILGILATNREDYARAQYHLRQSLMLAEQLQDMGAQVAALNNLALGARANDEADEAIALTQRALTLCTAQGDRHREAALHNNLADLLHNVGRGDEAMRHLKQAVALFAEVGEDARWQPEIWKLTEW